jgi:hypothetical protein
MSPVESKPGERIRIQLPIRVFGFDEARGRFEEDTNTIVVSPTGSLIVLKHRVFPADVIRIVNLANVQEADFRVAGPSLIGESEVAEWGVECTERDRNIWGIEFPPRDKNEPHVLLECRACHAQDLWAATVLEREILESTGIIAINCARCGKPTFWTFVDPGQRPQTFAQAEAVAPPPRVTPAKKFVERRKRRRMPMKVPVLVRAQSGEEEVSKTENLSNVGLAVPLTLELKEGEVVSILCPYTEGGQNIVQKARVRWRDPYAAGFKRLYGLSYKI